MEIIRPMYDIVWLFNEKKAGVYKDKKWGFIDSEGKKLTKEPRSYDRNVEKFIQFLDEGKANFKK